MFFYKLNPQLKKLSTEFTLDNWLFGSVKLTKIDDLDKYKYSSYSIGFGSCSKLLFTDGSFGLIWAHLCILIIKIKIS